MAVSSIILQHLVFPTYSISQVTNCIDGFLENCQCNSYLFPHPTYLLIHYLPYLRRMISQLHSYTTQKTRSNFQLPNFPCPKDSIHRCLGNSQCSHILPFLPSLSVYNLCLYSSPSSSCTWTIAQVSLLIFYFFLSPFQSNAQ